ncbi:hypothetical protein ACS33_14385 [Edwardsiella ictaluri]|nr:hypothetical protein ABY58_15050 [Edwardsiella ictaluri]KOO54362.1 hypothetical protein ACS33_14385 [Edwardsiella ictaluri]
MVLKPDAIAGLARIAVAVDGDVADFDIGGKGRGYPVREGDVVFIIGLFIIIFKRVAIHLGIIILNAPIIKTIAKITIQTVCPFVIPRFSHIANTVIPGAVNRIYCVVFDY